MRRLCSALAVATGLVLALVVAPAVASATTGPMVRTSTASCGLPLTVFTPTSTDVTAADFAAAGMRIPASSPLLQQALRSHAHWLSTVDCKARPDRTRPRPTTNAVSPNGFVGPTSPNWSGYEAPVASVSLASAEWNVPSVDGVAGPGTVTATSSIWPGIGEGTSTDELIQAGTEQDQFCFDVAGECSYTGQYYAWLEMFPAENQQVVSNLQVRPGDLIGVNVGYDPDLAQSAQFLLCNLSLNQCVSGGQTSPEPPSGNAEWVTERTGINGVLPPLAHYQGAVVFTDTITDTGFTPTGIGTAPPSTAAQDNATSITMHDCDGNTLSQPGVLESTGAFSTVWQHFGGTNC